MRIIAISLFLSILPLAPSTAQAAQARVGLQLAFANEQGNFLGSERSSRTQLIMFQPQLAVSFSGAEHPRWEFVTEALLAESIRPDTRFIHALSIGSRFHLRTAHTASGYLELGAGPGVSALHVDPAHPRSRNDPGFRQLSGWLQYHLQIGGGVRIKVGREAVQVGYRLTHFSNNDTMKPNLGLNMHTFVVSYQTRPF